MRTRVLWIISNDLSKALRGVFVATLLKQNHAALKGGVLELHG